MRLLVALAAFLLAGSAMAQNKMVVELANGEKVEYNTADVARVTFKEKTPTPPKVAAGFIGRFVRAERNVVPEVKSEALWADTVWRGERIHNQILLTTAETVANGVSFDVSALTNGSDAIDASCVTLRGVSYVAGDEMAKTCGEQTSRSTVYLGDALTDTPTKRITKTRPAQVWVTIDIPADVPAGEYTGNIVVKQNGEQQASLDVRLLVTDHTLPPVQQWAFHLDLWQFPFQLTKLCRENGVNIQPFSNEYFELMRPFYAMLADAGQKAITTYIKDGAFNSGDTMVDWSRDADGTLHFDYKKFDSYVEFMMSLGIESQINCYSMAGWNKRIGYTDNTDGAYKYMTPAFDSNEYASVWTQFLTDFRQHLTAKGWMERTVLCMDESREADMRNIIKVIRNNGTDWKIGLAGRKLASDVEKHLYDHSTIIGDYCQEPTHTRTTFYTSCSQQHPNNYVAADTETAEMTWMAWHAMARKLDGYLRWAYDYWTQTDPLSALDGSNTAGDFCMIYRTNNSTSSRPVASVRLELLREGIQDYEKVRILGRQQLQSVIALFYNAQAPNARLNVNKAQAKLKQVSAK